MVRHRPSLSHNTLTIWLQYLIIGVCAIPFAILALFLTRRGVLEQFAFLVAVALTLGASYGVWRLVISEPQKPVTLAFRGALILAFIPLLLLSMAALIFVLLKTLFLGEIAGLPQRVLNRQARKHPISD